MEESTYLPTCLPAYLPYMRAPIAGMQCQDGLTSHTQLSPVQAVRKALSILGYPCCPSSFVISCRRSLSTPTTPESSNSSQHQLQRLQTAASDEAACFCPQPIAVAISSYQKVYSTLASLLPMLPRLILRHPRIPSRRQVTMDELFCQPHRRLENILARAACNIRDADTLTISTGIHDGKRQPTPTSPTPGRRNEDSVCHCGGATAARPRSNLPYRH